MNPPEDAPVNETVPRGSSVAFADFHAPPPPWRVLLPPVYRYLPEQFAAAFFENGELMLSSFVRFRRHVDEARGDSQEGRLITRAIGGDKELWAVSAAGQDALVVCGSLSLDRQIMEKFEGCNACIEITNVPSFGLEVARQLPGFRAGLSGHCIYGTRMLERHVEGDPFPLPEGPEKVIPLEQLFERLAAVHHGEEYLIKERGFAYQAEYRLLWFVDPLPTENIIIKVPNARAFCRAVAPSEIR